MVKKCPSQAPDRPVSLQGLLSSYSVKCICQCVHVYTCTCVHEGRCVERRPPCGPSTLTLHAVLMECEVPGFPPPANLFTLLEVAGGFEIKVAPHVPMWLLFSSYIHTCLDYGKWVLKLLQTGILRAKKGNKPRTWPASAFPPPWSEPLQTPAWIIVVAF